MNLLSNYLRGFKKRSGSLVFFSTIIARILSFVASWIALQLIPNNELGIVLYAFHIVAFIIPITGLGLHQGLLRFGSLLEGEREKNNLFLYVFRKGIAASICIIVVICIFSFLYPFQFKNAHYYVMAFSLLLLPSFLFEIIKIRFRLLHKNHLFAYSEIVYNIILVIAVFSLSYQFEEIGYALALIVAPTLTILFFIPKISFKNPKKQVIKKGFWKYGVFASLANVATQFLFIIDILLIGYFLKDATLVTTYKYITLVPLSLLFLPRVFINTDFVTLTEKIKNTVYTKQYIKSYLLLFSIISLLMISILGYFSEEILLFFDPSFRPFKNIFLMFLIGVSGILIFRGLFGNLLSSIGKANINFYITGVAILLNICSNIIVIPVYGLVGAAMTSAVLMWLTGIASTVFFYLNYKKFFLYTE